MLFVKFQKIWNLENSENFLNFKITKNSINSEIYNISYILSVQIIQTNIKIKNKFENKKIEIPNYQSLPWVIPNVDLHPHLLKEKMLNHCIITFKLYYKCDMNFHQIFNMKCWEKI